VVVHFVDIGRIVDHHRLKIFSLMIIKRSKKNGFQNMNLEIFWTRLY
jgi:hypothetical protein